MGGRRLLNRLGSLFSRRRPAPEEGGASRRTATPGKAGWGAILLPLLGILILPQAFFLSSQILSRVSESIENGGAREREPERFEEPGDDTATDAERELRKAGLRFDWPAPEDEPRFLAAVAVVLGILWVAILFATLGAQNQDLGHVEWSFEWFFTFPARARSLFLAKLLEYAALNAFTWITVFPLVAVLCFRAGRGWGAVPIAAGATLCWNLLLAAARLLLETWLRKSLPLARVKNLQALFSLAGMLALYAVLYLGVAEETPAWFRAAARAGPAIAWMPPALPAYLAARALPSWGAAAALLLGTAACSAGGVLLASRLVRDGLVLSGGGPLRGTRGKAGAGRRRTFALGIAGKDLLLLGRDRSFLVQTLFVPILIIGFQLVINRALLDASSRDLRHGSTFAFGIGAYVLMFTGFSVLSSEGQGLWLLYTFPRRLSAMLREKTLLWAVISLVYVAGVLAILLARGAVVDAASLPAVFMAVLGVLIYAYVAAGLGVLGADPLAQQAHRKVRPGMAYLFLLLASMYAYGIYAPSLWQKASLIVLCSLLAFAIWQKVEDRLPYLLDPTARPPPRIGLSDGLIAALAFFVIQGVVALLWIAGGGGLDAPSRGFVVTAGFLTAGFTVCMAAFHAFESMGVPDVLQAVGLRPGPGARCSTAGAVGQGVVLGAAAAAFGLVYLEALLRLPFLEDLRRHAASERTPGWILLFPAVVAAPLFEEFIFRGLVYRGLRRTFRTSVSVLASAGIFAIVHPPHSVLPVFFLGIAAAVSFERTGLLAAPIAAHFMYNAAVVSASMWRLGGS
jgi:membrane protease YdiL (CAAX protease family)